MDWQSAQNAVKSLGHIDLLVNNAGVSDLSPFIDVTMDSYDWRVHLPHTSTLINKIPKILFLLTCSVSIERKIFFSRDINQSINIFIRNRVQREIEVKKKQLEVHSVERIYLRQRCFDGSLVHSLTHCCA